MAGVNKKLGFRFRVVSHHIKGNNAPLNEHSFAQFNTPSLMCVLRALEKGGYV
jgi:hypothetical protein